MSAPPGDRTRPTGDRVREAVANALVSLDAVSGATVADLFAGSGALGIELLSRGAASATFVDDDRAAIDAVRANLETCGLTDRATVVRADVLAWCRSSGGGSASSRVDVAVCDPPYRWDGWDDLLAVVPADLVVAESDRALAVPPGWELVRERRYGTTLVQFIRRQELRA